MLRKSPPPLSRSAQRVMEYLDVVKSAQALRGYAKRYDFLKKAMNEAYTDYIIGYLKDNGLISEGNEGEYRLTKEGEYCLDTLKKHRNLAAIFTTELSGDRIRRWDS